MARHPLRPDAFQPRAGEGPSFASTRVMGGAVLLPLFAGLLLFGAFEKGGWSEVARFWPLWLAFAASFAYSVYVLVSET